MGGPMKTPKPYHQCSPSDQEHIRHEVVALLVHGPSIAGLARRYGVSRQTIYAWRDAANSASGLTRRPKGPPCALREDQRASLREMLLKGAVHYGFNTNLWTLERVRQLVRREFGVRYAPRSLWHVLQVRLDFSPQKPERQAREANPQRIAAWKKKFRRKGKKGAT